MNDVDIAAYHSRIGYDGPVDPTLETLRRFQMAHLLAVPFENLDIHIPRTIVLEEGRLFAKIVGERRGGFCYELNGLFAAMLMGLGFKVSMLAARVWGDGGYGVELAHMTLLITLDEPYLVDVGFGESFREPLRLVEGIEQPEALGVYRVMREGDLWRYESRHEERGWEPQYIFSTNPLTLAEFQPGCDYQQNSPDSHFKNGRLCSLARPDGRVTLRDDHLIVTKDGVKTETPIAGEGEFRAALKGHFGVTLPA